MPLEREGIRELYKQWRQQQWECKKKTSFDKYNVLVSHSMTMKMPSFMCYGGHK